MAKGPFLLKKFPVPKDSIALGSFVYNQLEPRQGYFDPSTVPTEYPARLGDYLKTDQSTIDNPFRTRGSVRSLSLQAALSKLAHGAIAGGWDDFDALRVKHATEYTVLDSDGWFNFICGEDAVRIWMEEALMKGRKALYLVTAYRTLHNAEMARSARVDANANLKFQVPTSPLGDRQGDSLDVSASGNATIHKGEDVSLKVPDEKIYEIQYRKVLFRGFASTSVDDAYLESGNRWIKLFTFRDGSDSPTDDAIETTLSDEIDIPEGYTKRGDGQEVLLLPNDEPDQDV